jgi:hypothetical protein
MPGLIIHGRIVPVPGVKVVTWLDDPRLALSSRTSRPRGNMPTAIILHSESGDDPHTVINGSAPDYDHGARLADIDETDARAGHPHSQHLDIGADATVYQFADLGDVVTYQAREANEHTIGIELHDPIVQVPDDPFRLATGRPTPVISVHAFYRAQLVALALVLDVVTRELGIQRQVQRVYRGPIDRLAGGKVRGIYGHRDQTDERGAGDPGDAPIAALLEAGYDGLDFARGEDIARWSERQVTLNHAAEANARARGEAYIALAVDGNPGPSTRWAIRALGEGDQRRAGMWIPRPGD